MGEVRPRSGSTGPVVSTGVDGPAQGVAGQRTLIFLFAFAQLALFIALLGSVTVSMAIKMAAGWRTALPPRRG